MTPPDLLIRIVGDDGAAGDTVDDEPDEWIAVGPLNPDELPLSGRAAFRCATSPPVRPSGDHGEDADDVCA